MSHGLALSDLPFLTFLGELRAGADVHSAAVVAEISLADGQRHAAAEQRGDYAEVVAMEPTWAVFGDRLYFGQSSQGWDTE